MVTLSLFFLIAALVCALFAALVIPNPPPGRPQLGWLAITLWIAAELVIRFGGR